MTSRREVGEFIPYVEGEPDPTDPSEVPITVSVAFHPSVPAAVGGGWDGRVRFWDTETREPVPYLLGDASRPVRDIAISPDGHLLAAASGEDVQLWGLVDLRPEGGPLPHTGQVTAVAFSPDGRTLVSTTWNGTLNLWRLTS